MVRKSVTRVTVPTATAKKAKRKSTPGKSQRRASTVRQSKAPRKRADKPRETKEVNPVADKGRPVNEVRNVDATWIQQRLKEQHKSQRQLAAAWGSKSASAVTRVLRDNRRLSLDEFVTLCDVLAVPVATLLPRLGYDLKGLGASAVISGAVTDTGQVTYVSVDVGRRMAIEPLTSSASALLVDAKEGPLAAYAGALVVYDTADHSKMQIYDRLAIIEVVGEVVPVLGVLSRGTQRGKLTLTRFGTGGTSDVDQVIRTHPVTRIIFN